MNIALVFLRWIFTSVTFILICVCLCLQAAESLYREWKNAKAIVMSATLDTDCWRPDSTCPTLTSQGPQLSNHHTHGNKTLKTFQNHRRSRAPYLQASMRKRQFIGVSTGAKKKIRQGGKQLQHNSANHAHLTHSALYGEPQPKRTRNSHLSRWLPPAAVKLVLQRR